MNIRWFTRKDGVRVSKVDFPAVRFLPSNGYIMFNSVAAKRFDLRQYRFVDIGVDWEKGIVGFKLKRDEGYRRLGHSSPSSGVHISATDIIRKITKSKTDWIRLVVKDDFIIAKVK